MTWRICFVLAALAASGFCPVRAAEGPSPLFEQRWFWAMTNLQVDRRADELLLLIERARKAGYNGMVLADYKLNVLDRVPAHYFTNLQRVKKAAAAAGIEIIPTVFPIGYSAGLLAHDPNLAEGVPVKDVPFTVKGREASLIPLSTAVLRNGGLEETRGDRFIGFSFQDEPGKQTFADQKTVRGGKVSCRMEHLGAFSPNTRLTQRVKVRPHACYRFSAWVKTSGLKPARNFKLMVLGGKGSPLTFQEGEAKPNQDWTRTEVVFNTLDHDEVTLYAGVWGGKAGTVWIDDLKLEELALVNVLRRPGCPFVVASGDGKIVYDEGKDYEPVRDEQLGRKPNVGDYEFRHSGAVLRLTEGSRIKDGDRLRVSWHHPIATHSYQVMCCLSEPKVYDLLREQARRVHKVLAPKTWFFSHDEIRVAGWCRSCQATRKTPGELLAANVQHCLEIVKKIDPKARIVVWSDMFDPNHNAVDRYYLVNGSWKGSWAGLTPDVTIANWNGGKAAASLKWFSERGHSQIIAGYYDGGLDNFHRWRKEMKGVKGVKGFMYTTWQNKYDLLEAYGKAILGKE